MKDLILEMYKEKQNITDISKSTGLSRAKIRDILKEEGVYSQKRKTSKKIDWDNFKDEVLKLYKDGISVKDISEYVGCNSSTILYKLNEWGEDTSKKRDSHNFKKYDVNENFFSSIDTMEKSYLLGFIVADGHISKDKKLMIGLQKADLEILEMAKKMLSSNHPIKESHDKTGFCLNIGSSVICNDLSNMGLNNRKSYDFDVEKLLGFIPNNLLNHFIRGYFDGDGCIKIYKQTHYNDKFIYHFSILGIEKMLIPIAKELSLDVSRIKKDERTVGTYQLICRKKSDIIRIREYLYDNSNKIYLNRKHDIFYNI